MNDSPARPPTRLTLMYPSNGRLRLGDMSRSYTLGCSVRVREPQRDEASALRRGDAARRRAARRTLALRPAGDGDQRVAGRGVDSDHPDGARGRELGAPRLVGGRLLLTAVRRQELDEVPERP